MLSIIDSHLAFFGTIELIRAMRDEGIFTSFTSTDSVFMSVFRKSITRITASRTIPHGWMIDCEFFPTDRTCFVILVLEHRGTPLL